jgi:hypothetical protein
MLIRQTRARRLPEMSIFRYVASLRCAAEFGRYRGIADSGKPSARQIYRFTA